MILIYINDIPGEIKSIYKKSDVGTSLLASVKNKKLFQSNLNLWLEKKNSLLRGYSLSRVNHPNNIKQRDVCIYFKESLLLTRRSYLSKMRECLVTEVMSITKNVFYMPYIGLQVKVMRS